MQNQKSVQLISRNLHISIYVWFDTNKQAKASDTDDYAYVKMPVELGKISGHWVWKKRLSFYSMLKLSVTRMIPDWASYS